MNAIHPEQRISAGPAGGVRVPENPPALLWPAAEGQRVRYTVRLSQDRRFPKGKTIGAEGLRWAMFNPHRKLAQGTWFWQYGVSKGGRKPVWSETFRFEVSRSARVRETPQAAFADCPAEHPRLWVEGAEVAALRRQVSRTAEVKRFVRQSERYLGQRLPGDRVPREKGESEYQARTYRRWASKALAGGMSGSIQWLAPAYLMTGDLRFGREAVRRALHVAGWNPDGFTAPGVSDFADGSCMRVLAQVYDSCFELLSEGEQGRLRRAMAVRAGRFFEATVNRLETRLFAAHIWQHILLEFAEVAIATLYEIPEAKDWAAYIYELWLARFPLMGGADGGWANGNGYFESNIETLLSMPVLFERLAGVDLYDTPWYRNAAGFLMTTWPPGSPPDGFGDGTEQRGHPRHTRLAFVESLAKAYRDPFSSWYVQKGLAGSEDLSLPPMMAWNRICAGRTGGRVRPRSPRSLPQAQAFRDVGIVSMHTDLADAASDLMVGFRSSPYGAYGHAHACQNSFNVLFGGERLFHNSGYYIAYGDEHFKGWYKHTRGHNTVLIDGKGQTFGSDRSSSLVRHRTEGYGWVARFLHGRRVSYCLGDASNAYGDAGLVRFRRHLVLLRPSTVVVYDELEADHPAEWGWLLHSVRKMSANGRLQRLRTKVRTARAQVDLLGSGPLRLEVDDRFDPPALNWRGKTFRGKVPAEYPRQWHATVSPGEPCEKMRYVAMIQVRAAGDSRAFDDPVIEKEGWLRVDDWWIQAELDASKKAGLVVRHRDGKAALAADRTGVRVGKEQYRTGRSKGSILVEVSGGGRLVRRSVDELPEAR